MGPESIEVGDVVQIDPTLDGRFGGCFLLVTKVRSWGVAGYVVMPGKGAVYHRIDTDAITRIDSIWRVPRRAS
ncbi:MAG: hypothetical protein ACRD1Q_08225 [Vicinamibacterales bacterium]